MNSLRKYFTSPMKSVSFTENTILQSSTSQLMSKIEVPVSSTKKSRTDGRKIIKNMEEVLNSVKEKHKNKHKLNHHHRRKDTNTQKSKTVQEIVDYTQILQGVSTSKENILICGKKNRHKKRLNNIDRLCKTDNKNSEDFIRPEKHAKLSVQHSESTSKKNLSSLTAVSEVLKSKEKNMEFSPEVDDTISFETNAKVVSVQKKKNAFEFMMNARNKSFGRNSPGKIEMVEDNIGDTNICSVKIKRKLFLEDWADKKGARKRKLAEDAREDYVDHLLTKRAKRLKKMIVSMTENTTTILPDKKICNKNTKNTAKTRENPKVGKINYKHLSSESEISYIHNRKQDTEFIEKLSSPIKTRSSLLGYFPKTISPIAEKKCKLKQNSSDIKKKYDAESDVCSLKNRPRRSCVGKACYDLDQSPTKFNLKLKLNRAVKIKISSPIDVEEDEDPDVICLANSSCLGNKLNKSENYEIPKKIAPLFVKTIRKPNIDPKIIEARHAFLMSGVPEKMKQEIAKQKHFVETFTASIEIFPKICHVPKWENDILKDDKWKHSSIIWIKENPSKSSVQLKKNKELCSILTKKNYTSTDLKNQNNQLTSLTPLPHLKNKITLIKNWKSLYEKFPTYKCYNQLREKYRYFSSLDTIVDTQQIAESFLVTKRLRNNVLPKFNRNEENDELPPDAAPNGELLFTEKYKPMSSDQVLVNLKPVNNLKEFLLSWQDDGRIQPLNDSMGDFDYNNDSNNSINGSNTSNAIVLLGPASSGKTQAVFALAAELNFNILEVNAGMKRTGKKLLHELQEATQSHQIRKDSKLAKKSMKKIPLNKTDTYFDSSSSSELGCTGKMSLILVEDADITFDQHDAGYIDAIYQLASMSKRPVVIIANNRNCPHLLRLINLNSIEFSAPNVLNISKFLTVLSLTENCPIDLDEIISLYLFNNMDIRKTILEIQFFIQSGGDRIKSAITNNKSTKIYNNKYYASPIKRRLSLETYQEKDECLLKNDKNDKKNNIYIHNSLFELFTRSQNFSTLIPYPVNLSLLWINLNTIFRISKSLSKRKTSNNPQIKNNTNGLSSDIQVVNLLVDFYENISVAACLSSKEIYDGLTLNMEEDISHFLIENSIRSILKINQCSYNFCEDDAKNKINLTSCTGNIPYNSKKAKYLDYEATLRSICRSEKNRSSLERRGTRFYHYLRNNCIKMNTFSTEIFDNASSILMDNTEIDNTLTIISEL